MGHHSEVGWLACSVDGPAVDGAGAQDHYFIRKMKYIVVRVNKQPHLLPWAPFTHYYSSGHPSTHTPHPSEV